ncbi:MAG: hypothetical protein ACI8RZ_005524 [Myxococcota bacterium]|jgi:hypothetical protein
MQKLWLLVPAVGIAAAGACFIRPQSTTVAPILTAPPLPQPGGTAGAFFGINEALSVPSALVFNRKVTGEQQRAELVEDGLGVRALGATIIRANSHTYPFFNRKQYNRNAVVSQERSDRYFSVLAESELDMLAVIGPWPGIQTGNHTSRYLPDDMDAYTRFVEDIVERYDGDGLDDAPSLRPVLAWEIDNEPDLHNRVPPRGAKRDVDPSTFQTPSEYAEVLLATAAAIRRADPDATILSGGMYNVRAPAGEAYLKAVLSTEGVLDAVDVIALHCYSDDDNLDAIEQTLAMGARLAPGKPIWITEIGVSSEGKHRWQSETWQAQMVVGIHAVALIGGAERLFWHTLADPPQRDDSKSMPFAHHSLMASQRSTWEPGEEAARRMKPAGTAYARLTTLLADVPRADIAEIPASGGRLMSAGDAMLAFWGTPQLPPGDWVIEDVLTGASLDAPVAPAWISPRGGK